MPTNRPLLYDAAVFGERVFEKGVELGGLEPLAFWMQTSFFACFCVAGRVPTGGYLQRLPPTAASALGEATWGLQRLRCRNR
jgi:hypothetical protein